MFIHNLNCEQQAVLLFLAHEVAKADGFLHEQQMEMMEILQQQSRDGVIETEAAIADLARIFDSEKAKSSALLELLGIAHANREYHVNERDLISCYAQAMNISTEKLLALEAWVEKQLCLYEEAEKLLENDV